MPSSMKRHRVRDDPAVVLVIGVDHDHDVGAAVQGFPVARLLVAAVAAVRRVNDDRQAHLAGHLDRAVRAAVVDEDDLVHAAGRHVGQGRRQGALGVVGRHDGDDAMLPLRRPIGLGVGDPLGTEELARRSMCGFCKIGMTLVPVALEKAYQ